MAAHQQFVKAVRDGRVELVADILTRHRIDLEDEAFADAAQSWVRMSALCWSALWGSVPLAQLLLDRGAKVRHCKVARRNVISRLISGGRAAASVSVHSIVLRR